MGIELISEEDLENIVQKIFATTVLTHGSIERMVRTVRTVLGEVGIDIIAPEPPKPKVRAYDNCIEPAKKLASLPEFQRYINYEGRRCFVSMVGIEYVFLDNCRYNKIHYNVLADATWSDGTPFGIPEQP